MAGIFSAVAAPSAQQQLLEQVRVGEATNREDLVRQSLYRLELIAPDDPQVIAAKMRYALRQGDSNTARQALDRLSSLAPGSDVYYQARNSMMLSGAQGRQQLQQARLLATAGKPVRLSVPIRHCSVTIRPRVTWRWNTGASWPGSLPAALRPLRPSAN